MTDTLENVSKLTKLCKEFLANNKLYNGESICISKEPYRADSEHNVYAFLMEMADIVGYPEYIEDDGDNDND